MSAQSAGEKSAEAPDVSNFACVARITIGKVGATRSGERAYHDPYIGLGLPFEE